MIRPLVRRRYGHGAARLPIGGSLAGPSMSEIAAAPVAGERSFATGPSLGCALAAALLLSVAELDTTEPALFAAAPSPTMEMQLWSETTAEPAPHAAEPIAADRPVDFAAIESSAIPAEPDPSKPIESTGSAFDPSLLAMRAPDDLTPSNLEPLESSSPLVRGDPARPIARGHAQPRPPLAVPAPIPAPAEAQAFEASPALAGPANPMRPGGSSRPAAGATLQRPVWTPNEERRAFLNAQAKREAAVALASATTFNRPSVSATTANDVDVDWNALRAGGWHEVPLDELPDCTPAGRQDLLKKSILLAAPFERECSHQDGSYRFVETRNLGAFLMWSRSNPDRPVARQRDRDVCDVLERALRCLGGSSIEESTAR
ncbi:MAG: hypothetical protein CL908_27220 [Deltaproteobacteria bacterium]|nr:hypothetical protein [Deltaproteobacteria bacterium]